MVANPITEQKIATPDMDSADNNVRYAINIVLYLTITQAVIKCY